MKILLIIFLVVLALYDGLQDKSDWLDDGEDWEGKP